MYIKLDPRQDEIILSALRRSLGKNFSNNNKNIFIVSPKNLEELEIPEKSKVIVLGNLKDCPIAQSIVGVSEKAVNIPNDLGACKPNLESNHTESSGKIHYDAHELTGRITPVLSTRPFVRFDFTDEWNNLGFGRITTDGDLWSVQPGIFANEGTAEIAKIISPDQPELGSYITLKDTENRSVLWCNRPAGTVDSTEWTVIELFLSDWRCEELPCLPSLLQAPFGYSAVCTMRLDCDEDIGSATNVFELYRELGIPFSLAVKTSLEMKDVDRNLIKSVIQSGGSILSHTHTHPFNWGATEEDVSREWLTSKNILETEFPEVKPLEYAVSPFHTNPTYAVQRLEKDGVKGLVTGIIHNDPEYMIGRAGYLPFTENKMISVSQQCMLHGDTYKLQNCTVDSYLQAFELLYAANGIFGYLDHPFSVRYQYGWDTHEQRLTAHRQFLAGIRKYPNVLFMNQNQCLDFVRKLSDAEINPDTSSDSSDPAEFKIAYRYKKKICSL
jgi:hypothetical protein